MNISPLELRQQQFRKSFRGFDPLEVTSFLLTIAEDYETALRERSELRTEVGRLRAALAEHRGAEDTLKVTLITAQKLADDIKASAAEEGRRVVRDAQGRADLLLEKTQARLDEAQRDIDSLRMKRKDVETSIESTVQTLRHALEFVREQETRERDDKVLLHRPRLDPALVDPMATIEIEVLDVDNQRRSG
jgi:cell division initiation protein